MLPKLALLLSVLLLPWNFVCLRRGEAEVGVDALCWRVAALAGFGSGGEGDLCGNKSVGDDGGVVLSISALCWTLAGFGGGGEGDLCGNKSVGDDGGVVLSISATDGTPPSGGGGRFRRLTTLESYINKKIYKTYTEFAQITFFR